VRLLSTGFFEQVNISLQRGSKPRWVIITIEVTERNTFIIQELALGASKITPYIGIETLESNFKGQGISLSLGSVVAEKQMGIRFGFASPYLFRTPLLLKATLFYNKARDFFGHGDVMRYENGEYKKKDYIDINYRRQGGILSVGIEIAGDINLYLDWDLEEVFAQLPQKVRWRNGDLLKIEILQGTSIISGPSITLERDTQDDPFSPSLGSKFLLSAQIISKIFGADYNYLKFNASFFKNIPLILRHILRFKISGGVLIGKSPFFAKYFIGDLSDLIPSRVMELNFHNQPPPNIFNTAIKDMWYEESFGKLQLEYLIPLYKGKRFLYGANFFCSWGLIFLQSLDGRFSPYTPSNSLPLDFTLDLGFNINTEIGIFALSFSNLLGLIPSEPKPIRKAEFFQKE
jgi:outer membrane protein assembly factor BamA